MKRPAFQFYPADWRKDPALSVCSLTAKGLWIELMCVAHESDNYGYLSINGNPMTLQQIARTVGELPNTVSKLLAELEAAGVFSRSDEGCIFSRRMVRDERIRNVRADAGRLGGNPNLLKQKVKDLVKQNDEQILTPSSSSSSSSSNTDTSPAKLPTCPTQKLIDLYHAELPELPAVRLMNDKRKKALGQFWTWVLTSKRTDDTPRATTAEEALAWVGDYFARAKQNDFLMGRTNRGDGHANWTADLEFLLTDKGKAHVIEKTRG